jgi:hypothetical protein
MPTSSERAKSNDPIDTVVTFDFRSGRLPPNHQTDWIPRT